MPGAQRPRLRFAGKPKLDKQQIKENIEEDARQQKILAKADARQNGGK